MSVRLSVACRSFEEGLNDTKSSFLNPSLTFIQDNLSFLFNLKSGIENITNGIMNDDRCFHLENEEGDLLKRSIMVEYLIKRPLDSDAMSVEELIRQYRIKKQCEGWDIVRRELTANIRVSFLLGYINKRMSGGAIEQLEEEGIDQLQKSIDLIVAARSLDPGVSHPDRGVIFKPTFIRCLQVHLIRALMELFETKNDYQILNRIENEATDIINSCENNPISRVSEPLEYLCYLAPHFSEAYAGLGFIAFKRFNYKLKDVPDLEILKLAINNYEKSIQYLPNDDPDKAKIIYSLTFCKLGLGNFPMAEINNHVIEAKKVEKDAKRIMKNLDDINEHQPRINVVKFLKSIKRPDNITKNSEFILPPLYDIDFKDKNFGQALALKIEQHVNVSELTEEMNKITT